MLMWLKKMIRRWVLDAQKEDSDLPILAAAIRRSDDPVRNTVAAFHIEQAINGHIISMKVCVPAKNRNHNSDTWIEKAYIVPEGVPIMEAIAACNAIASMETPK